MLFDLVSFFSYICIYRFSFSTFLLLRLLTACSNLIASCETLMQLQTYVINLNIVHGQRNAYKCKKFDSIVIVYKCVRLFLWM